MNLDAAIHYPFVREFEEYWFNKATPASLRRPPLQFVAVLKALNMSEPYAANVGCGAREHMQNWWDECRVRAGDGNLFVHLMNHADSSEIAQRHNLMSDAKAYAAFHHHTLLGVVLDCTDKAGQQLLFLKNYGGQMTLDDLILGESTKRSNMALAGQFGEGGKVEINRLVQEGCTVKYWTGNATWTFARLTAPGCTKPELHVTVQPGQEVYHFVGIAISATPTHQQRLLQVDQCLFLQGNYSKIASEVNPERRCSGMELLLDQPHWGKVFIQGIYVADEETYTQFGLNYTGDKTIYPLLGLDRDRNGIYVKRLVMGIPAMVQDLLDRKTQDQECQRQYGLAMTRLTQLMWQEGSALKELNDGLYSFIFPDFCTHRRQLAQSLLDYFREHHPAAVPICSACTQVEDQAKVGDIQYLGLEAVEVSETMYLLFNRAGLLQSREELWELRKDEILAMPDPLASLSADQRHGLDSLRDELEKVYKKYITADQIRFRAMPGRNLYVLRGFTSHFVIDTNIICNHEEVQKHLTRLYGADSECQSPSQCARQLLIHSMADALSRQKGASKDRILHDVMGQYIRYSQYELNLPTVSSAANSDGSRTAPNSHVPNAPTGDAAPSVAPHDMRAAAPSHVPNLSSDQQNSSAEASTAPPDSQSQPSSYSQPQAAVRIVRERETPFVPSLHDPVVFHNNIKAGLASVMQQSAGQANQPGVVRSCNQPSTGGVADTVTVRLCPNGSKHNLVPSNITLKSCIVEGNEKMLYVPTGFDLTEWSGNHSSLAQNLYHLLERLHELIEPGMAAVNLYYDADDGCIAFNKGNKLWYNAYADGVYSQASQSFRLFNWYITMCHELAHNFHNHHDEVFSDYLAHIVLQYSRGFYDLCRRYQIGM